MVEGVFRLSDRRIDMIVTPRTELEWLNLESPLETWDQIIFNTNFNHLPVVEGDLDKVVGIIRTRDFLKKRLSGQAFDPRDLLLPAVFIPESSPALTALGMIKRTQSNMGMIIDEYGGLLGIITLNDLMEAIIGSIATIGLDDEDGVIERADGSWLVDGLLPVDELKELMGVNELTGKSDYGYQTMGGFMMAQLGAIPNMRNPNSVDHPRKALMGDAILERNKIGRATDFAIPSGLFNPNRLGTNSPITNDK